jgi:hypothetical protein
LIVAATLEALLGRTLDRPNAAVKFRTMSLAPYPRSAEKLSGRLTFAKRPKVVPSRPPSACRTV